MLLLTLLFRASSKFHLRRNLTHRHDRNRVLLLNRLLARRVHAHLKLSGDLEGSDFTEACRVHSTALLLITGGKFESAATSYLAAGASVSGLAS